ncbi:MAG: acyltransferase family protein [Blastocatellia bacterium]
MDSHAPETGGAVAHGLGYRPELDGVRGVSILLVVVHHLRFTLVGGGFLGVDVFFVLSGFLITTLLAREWEARGAISLRAFYLRRVLRLAPALLTLLICMCLYAAYSLDGELARDYYLASGATLLYVSNYIFAAWEKFSFTPMGITWSLAVEEQFYLLWPPVFCLLLRRRVRRGRVIAGLCVAIALIALNRALLWNSHAVLKRMYYGSDTRFDALLAGCLLALLLAWRMIPAPGRLARALAIVPGVWLVYWLGNAHFTMEWLYKYGGFTLVAIVLAYFLWLIWHDAARPLTWVLRLPPLVWLGKVSYGLYLWHWAVVVFFYSWNLPQTNRDLIRAVAIMLVVTAFSYYVIERPFLALKNKHRGKEPAC